MPGQISAELSRAPDPWNYLVMMLPETHGNPASLLFFLAEGARHPCCNSRNLHCYVACIDIHVLPDDHK